MTVNILLLKSTCTSIHVAYIVHMITFYSILSTLDIFLDDILSLSNLSNRQDESNLEPVTVQLLQVAAAADRLSHRTLPQ